MGWGTGNLGGGSGGLNFKVVGYATESELLAATPKANTIGIISTTEMTGWIIDANQPENMTNGMVWLSVGTESTVEFNALKKNALQVYPLAAKQMVSGALVNVVAMSYQNGKWGMWWSGELFDNGNQFEAITGGWARNSNLYFEYSGKNTGKVTIGDTIQLITTSNQCAVVTTRKKVDLSRFDTLNAIPGSNSGAYYVVVHSNESGNLQTTYVATSGKMDGSEPANVDISTLKSGEYFISVLTWNNRTAVFEKINLI